MKKKKIADLREDYSKKTLNKSDVVSNPIEQFRIWFEEAQNSQVPEPNAMTLASATPVGSPSVQSLRC